MQINEFGKILGGLVYGWITDKIEARCILLPFTMLIATLNFILLFLLEPTNLLMIYIMIFTSGILIVTPKILCGPVAQEIVKSEISINFYIN